MQDTHFRMLGSFQLAVHSFQRISLCVTKTMAEMTTKTDLGTFICKAYADVHVLRCTHFATTD